MRWLQLPRGAEVLDLCCGLRVTGMDLSEELLNEARRHDRGKGVKWLKADMRHIPIHNTFAAVVNLFTSF